MKDFQEFLRCHDACKGAIEWVWRKTPREVWRTCPRGDWLLWLAEELEVDRKLLVTADCDCAELPKAKWPPGDDRLRIAIETARKWVRGEATVEEVRKAANAARSANAATYVYFAVYYAARACDDVPYLAAADYAAP